MRRAVEAGELTEMQENTDYEARINQQRHEPVPASHRAGHDQSAADGNKGRPAARPDRPPAAGQGDAVRAMMGGPPPQGDVPDAPATQIAGAHSENGRVTRVSQVANAVPGKPDGEVDTRS
jgi:hypothetical protein